MKIPLVEGVNVARCVVAESIVTSTIIFYVYIIIHEEVVIGGAYHYHLQHFR